MSNHSFGATSSYLHLDNKNIVDPSRSVILGAFLLSILIHLGLFCINVNVGKKPPLQENANKIIIKLIKPEIPIAEKNDTNRNIEELQNGYKKTERAKKISKVRDVIQNKSSLSINNSEQLSSNKIENFSDDPAIEIDNLIKNTHSYSKYSEEPEITVHQNIIKKIQRHEDSKLNSESRLSGIKGEFTSVHGDTYIKTSGGPCIKTHDILNTAQPVNWYLTRCIDQMSEGEKILKALDEFTTSNK
jgi:hypothetical protein